MHKHESELCQHLLSGLAELPLRIIGKNTSDWREANVALVSEKHSSAALSKALAEKDIAANSGDFYARRLLEKLGVTNKHGGVLRISLAHYNTREEVERALEVLEAIH